MKFFNSADTPRRDLLVEWGMKICTAAILGGLSLVSYWMFIDRSDPVTVHYGEVLNFERQADDSWIIIIKWHGERHRQCWGNSKRWISGGFVLPLPDIPYPPDRPEQKLGEFEWEVPVMIPSYYVSTGHHTGQYAIRIFYSCNPIQDYVFPIVIEPPPIPFSLPLDMPRKQLQTGDLRSFKPEEAER